MMLIISFVIFFFKQRTAYEMRISDGSSDVCSSDLQADALGVACFGVGNPDGHFPREQPHRIARRKARQVVRQRADQLLVRSAKGMSVRRLVREPHFDDAVMRGVRRSFADPPVDNAAAQTLQSEQKNRKSGE